MSVETREAGRERGRRRARCRCGVLIARHRPVDECAGDPRHPEQTLEDIYGSDVDELRRRLHAAETKGVADV